MMGLRRLLAGLGKLEAPLWAAVVLAILRPQGDPDYWWHLRVGEWIATHHEVPRTELLSWLGGGPWTAHEWAGELLLYVLHTISGVYGSILLLGAVNIAAIVVALSIVRLLRPGTSNLALAGLAVVMAFVADPIWLPRLQAFDLLFGLLALRFALDYLERGARRGLLVMPILMVAWVNLHGGGVSMYVILMAAVLVGEWWNRHTRDGGGRSWRPLLISMVATITAMAINPIGLGMYTYPLGTVASPAMQDLILEWQSPDFHALAFRFAQAFLAFGLVGVVALSRIRDGRSLALTAGLAFMFLQSGRYVGFLALVGVAVMGPALIEGAETLWHGIAGRPFIVLEPVRGRTMRALILALVTVMLFIGQLASLPAMQDVAIAAEQPVAATNWLEDHPVSGRLFNDYDWGGYLSWRLRVPVGFYGAADAFGETGLRDAGDLAALTIDPGPYLDTHDVAEVITRAQGPLGQWLRASSAWQRIYSDDLTAIFLRAPGPMQP